MASSSVYRTHRGRAEIMALYDEALSRLDQPVESRMVATPFGATHVLTTGPAGTPPVVVLHGGNFLNPYTLAWVLPGLRDRRVYAPDTPGHPGRSAEIRLSPRDDSYGRWVVGLLNALGLDRASFVGTSYGAGILLRVATAAPERLERAVLHVPSSIALGSARRMIVEAALPMLRYRFAPSQERLERAARPLSTEPLDDLGLRMLGAVYRHVRLETRFPRRASRAPLAAFAAPTLVLAAEDDLFFPAHLVLPRTRVILPRAVTGALPGGHFPSAPTREELQDRIRRFMASEQPSP